MDNNICNLCGYIYYPVKGDSNTNINPGTKFKDLPNSWVCPVCGASKGDFEIVDG